MQESSDDSLVVALRSCLVGLPEPTPPTDRGAFALVCSIHDPSSLEPKASVGAKKVFFPGFYVRIGAEMSLLCTLSVHKSPSY
jgi:hypothetical protein